MSIKRRLAQLANICIRPLGAELVSRAAILSWQHFFDQAKRYKFEPKTVFDVGVAYGTPWLYEAFPHASYFLIDPLREALPHMERIKKSLNATILNVALGESAGIVNIEARENIRGSTIFAQEGEADSRLLSCYPVEVKRLDEIVPAFPTPALCKIDVQGAELGVLKGMSGIMAQLDVVIVECHTLPTLRGIPEAAEVIHLMNEYGFCIYDVAFIGRRPLDGATAELDVVFVKKDSVFRSDHRWR